MWKSVGIYCYKAATAPTSATAAAAIGPMPSRWYMLAPAVDCVEPALPVDEPEDRAEEVTLPVEECEEPDEVDVAI